MKKMSLVKKEMLTVGLGGIAYIVTGVLNLIKTDNYTVQVILTVLSALAFVVLVSTMLIEIKGKADVWDETASEHYATARKITIWVIKLFVLSLLVAAVSMKAAQKAISITLEAGYLFIVYGLIELVLCGSFVYLEKRDA